MASAHLGSGDICVFSLPGLNLLRVVPMSEQPCFDDVNPHCLKKDARQGEQL